MKLMHIADLHIGKRVNEFSMIEDQRYILDRLTAIAVEEQVDAVLIAGDVYDKSVPSAEAMETLDKTLTFLSESGIRVFIIAGNHDSAERLSFLSRIAETRGIYIAGASNVMIRKIETTDEHGPLNIYLMPYVRTSLASSTLGRELETGEDAVRAILTDANVDFSKRNLLVAHQFVTNGAWKPATSDSETGSLGGLDVVDASVFEGFDYVALGHLHSPQRVSGDRIRYSGSPLKYSASETSGAKSAVIVEIASKGDVRVSTRKLSPIRDTIRIRGPLASLLEAAGGSIVEDYVHAILTDEDELLDAAAKLRRNYPNLMSVFVENSKTTQTTQGDIVETARRRSVREMFSDFYLAQNGEGLAEEAQRMFDDALAMAEEEN